MKKQLNLFIIISSLLLTFFFSSFSVCAENISKSESKIQWIKTAEKAKLSKPDIEKLKKQKVLMTNETYKQVFEPYIEGNIPLFITSDSLLNAYHVLFEESILRLEKANTKRLSKILKIAWDNLQNVDKGIKGDSDLIKPAKKRALIIVGVSLKLMGDKSLKCDKDIEKIIDKEVKKIEKGTGSGKPKWLGKPDPGFLAIDYSRYKPRGFYTRNDKLKKYFRTVSWLQSIPFRLKNDEEFLSILMLGYSINKKVYYEKRRMIHSYFDCYRQFIGDKDDWDLEFASKQSTGLNKADLNSGYLENLRKKLTADLHKSGDAPRINDQIRFMPENTEKPAEVGFRIISAYRTPDSIMFFRTTGEIEFSRAFPTGLEVCAALGSQYAAKKLVYKDKKKLLKKIEECKVLFKGDSLYLDYLNCLKALLDKPQQDAPAFMKGDAWKIKSLQTVLASWAQMRHTWALQAKQAAFYAGGAELPPGFVEPDPEFYLRMNLLAKKTRKLLGRAGVFIKDTDIYAQDIREAIALLNHFDIKNSPEIEVEKLTGYEKNLYFLVQELIASQKIEANYKDSKKYWTEAIEKLNRIADDFEKGKTLKDERAMSRLEMRAQKIEPSWKELEELCTRLESLSHKELRGVKLSKVDQSFILGYGTRLAGIMLYGGNSYLTPRDDAPRIVDVFSNPNTNEYLEVGISRARALYVLYPFKGKEILCRGAVLPYYEFISKKRYNDKEWKNLLTTDKRPSIPLWLNPIVWSKGIGKPDRRLDY